MNLSEIPTEALVLELQRRGIRITASNARLIAAAPDLLEACLKLVEWDDREKDHAISFMARIDLCEEAFTAMRAAIAKATQ